ncbi:MAG: hypothetical protein PVJ86_08625, partial [Phycisphaerales bacterium]
MKLRNSICGTQALFVTLILAIVLGHVEDRAVWAEDCELILRFEPPYIDSSHWDDDTIGIDESESSANNLNGEVAAWAAAWVGAATAEAKQYVQFELSFPARVTVDANIVYVGGAPTFGPSAFAGIAAVWKIDSEDSVLKYIDPPLGFDDAAGIVCDLAGLAPGAIAQAIDILGYMLDAQDLAGLTDKKEYHMHFTFDAAPGRHRLGVGVQSNISAVVFGAGQAVIAGMVKDIKLTLATVITEDTVWDEDMVRKEGVIVESGARLTITPGHTISFDPNTVLCVKGILEAEGVQFTS